MNFSSGSDLREMLAYTRRSCCSIVLTAPGRSPSSPKTFLSSRLKAELFVYIGCRRSCVPRYGTSSRGLPLESWPTLKVSISHPLLDRANVASAARVLARQAFKIAHPPLLQQS